MPEPTPFRLSSAEDRFRSGVSASLLGQSAEVAQSEPRLLEEISPGPPSAGGTKSPPTALAGPRTAASESCKQQLGYPPSADFSFACLFWATVSRFLQTTSLWCRPCRWFMSRPMLSRFFKSRALIQTLRDGPVGSPLESFAQALFEAGYATFTA